MKNILTIIIAAVVCCMGFNEIHAQHQIVKPQSKKTQTKKSSTKSSVSTKFSIETLLDKYGNGRSSLGTMLEKAGFKKHSQRQFTQNGDNFGDYVEKIYVKNGIKVSYDYEKASKGILCISIVFPDKSSQKEFVNTIRPYANKNGLDMEWYSTNIEFPTNTNDSYCQISMEGLKISFIWI